ncbi:hypothetical protein OsJ_13261 [Oryza sativa Japonica Group]|uniref:Uncharacterized protein n=1 Tax=Oryza sativa subsp. japonica TaxID=39947 RepID=A3APG2_ORYSJ|nr:hypothetical protein OsJ_13261 [Oryza sativa Japonica Group]
MAEFEAAAEQFRVFIQETKAKAEEAYQLAVLIQKAAAGGGSDVAAALEVCKKAAEATAAGGASSDAAATSEICKAADVMVKEVAAHADLIQEGSAEEEAYRPPVLIPVATARDFGGSMRGLTQSCYMSVSVTNVEVMRVSWVLHFVFCKIWHGVRRGL